MFQSLLTTLWFGQMVIELYPAWLYKSFNFQFIGRGESHNILWAIEKTLYGSDAGDKNNLVSAGSKQMKVRVIVEFAKISLSNKHQLIKSSIPCPSYKNRNITNTLNDIFD